MLPPGKTLVVEGEEHKCFPVHEWRDLGALILDYRLLFVWSGMAEKVLIERTTSRDARSLEAHELRRAVSSMHSAYAAELERLETALEASEHRRRMQAFGLGGLAALGVAVSIAAIAAN